MAQPPYVPAPVAPAAAPQPPPPSQKGSDMMGLEALVHAATSAEK
jgi:hypothetical protein